MEGIYNISEKYVIGGLGTKMYCENVLETCERALSEVLKADFHNLDELQKFITIYESLNKYVSMPKLYLSSTVKKFIEFSFYGTFGKSKLNKFVNNREYDINVVPKKIIKILIDSDELFNNFIKVKHIGNNYVVFNFVLDEIINKIKDICGLNYSCYTYIKLNNSMELKVCDWISVKYVGNRKNFEKFNCIYSTEFISSKDVYTDNIVNDEYKLNIVHDCIQQNISMLGNKESNFFDCIDMFYDLILCLTLATNKKYSFIGKQISLKYRILENHIALISRLFIKSIDGKIAVVPKMLNDSTELTNTEVFTIGLIVMFMYLLSFDLARISEPLYSDACKIIASILENNISTINSLPEYSPYTDDILLTKNLSPPW